MHTGIKELVNTLHSSGLGWVADLITDELTETMEAEQQDGMVVTTSPLSTRQQLAAVERVVRHVFLEAYDAWRVHEELMQKFMPRGARFEIGDFEVGDAAGIPLFGPEYGAFHSSLRKILDGDDMDSKVEASQ